MRESLIFRYVRQRRRRGAPAEEEEPLAARAEEWVAPVVAADRWLAEQGDVQRERQNYAGANYDRAYDQPVDKDTRQSRSDREAH